MNHIIEKIANVHKVLREFYKITNGQTNAWNHLDKIAISVGIGGEKFREVHSYLLGEGLIEPYGAGYTVTLAHKAGKYIEGLNILQEKDIILNTLTTLRPFPNKYISIKTIFDYIGVLDEESYRKEILDTMYKHDLIERANTDEWNAKISEKGRKLTSATFDLLQINTSTKKSQTKKGTNEKTGDMTKRKPKSEKIFISHSTVNYEVSSKFCSLILGNVFNIPHKNIFNTSHVGTKPYTGEDFRNRIKKELEESTVIFQFISKAYKESEVCLIEMGAAWVLCENVIPLIVEKGEYDVGFIHSTNQQAQLHNKKHLLKALSDLMERNLLGPSRPDVLSDRVDEFVDWLNKYEEQKVKPSVVKPNNANGGKKEVEMENDIKIIRNYLESKKFTHISFEKLIELDPKYTEQHIAKLIRKFPDDITRAKAKGKPGIQILFPDFDF